VFDVVIHAGDFASWNPTIKSSRQLSPDPIGEGRRSSGTCGGFDTDLGGRTRVDHELEMIPKGAYKLLAPMMSMGGRRNVRATANALDERLRS
jgi:hypothetical protein